MDKLNERKKKLIALQNDDFNDVNILIYMLIKKNKLDNLISKIDDVNTPTNVCSIVKKGYLTPEEQFLQLLYNLIYHINTDFWFIKNYKGAFIETMLSNDAAEELLLSKKYFHDNNNIPYYRYYIHKTAILNFYNNLMLIPQSQLITNFFKKHGIENIKEININDYTTVDKLYKILRLICICNNNEFSLFYIFDYDKNNVMINMLETQFKSLIERTNKKEKTILSLLND